MRLVDAHPDGSVAPPMLTRLLTLLSIFDFLGHRTFALMAIFCPGDLMIQAIQTQLDGKSNIHPLFNLHGNEVGTVCYLGTWVVQEERVISSLLLSLQVLAYPTV